MLCLIYLNNVKKMKDHFEETETMFFSSCSEDLWSESNTLYGNWEVIWRLA